MVSRMSIWNDLWELFFPRYCVICGKRLSSSEECLCVGCLFSLPQTRMLLQEENELEKNFWGRFFLGRAVSCFYYSKGGDVRKLMYELKYHGNKEIGLFMGRYMAMNLHPDFFKDMDAIIPIPLHPEKKRKRGYNQSELLAMGISQITGLPVWTDVIERVQFTETQTHKSQHERWMNVSTAFSRVNEYKVAGKHVLLVDDVLTTGATIIACADVLKEVANIKISVLTLAWAADS